LRRLNDDDYKQTVYEVMRVIFAVHNEMGGLFDEPVYQQATAQRLAHAKVEVALGVSFESFLKTYFLDLLVSDGAVFELKAADSVNDRNRSQTLNYLLLAELPHGKLVNFRQGSVEHEFVNAPLTRADRTAFLVEHKEYEEMRTAGFSLRDLFVTILRDWGTCLDLALYEEALIHFLGGQQKVAQPVEICVGGRKVGQQRLNLITPDVSLCLTAINDGHDHYERELRRFLKHTNLKGIQWVNVARRLVTFKSLRV